MEGYELTGKLVNGAELYAIEGYSEAIKKDEDTLFLSTLYAKRRHDIDTDNGLNLIVFVNGKERIKVGMLGEKEGLSIFCIYEQEEGRALGSESSFFEVDTKLKNLKKGSSLQFVKACQWMCNKWFKDTKVEKK